MKTFLNKAEVKLRNRFLRKAQDIRETELPLLDERLAKATNPQERTVLLKTHRRLVFQTKRLESMADGF